MEQCTSCINYMSKSENYRYFIASYVQPVIQQYESTTVQKEPFCSHHMRSTVWMISVSNGSHHMLTTKLTLFLRGKMNGTQRRALVSPQRMHCMYSGSLLCFYLEKETIFEIFQEFFCNLRH